MTLSFSHTKRQHFIECLALLLIAVVLRAWCIGKTDLGYDESFTLYMSLQSVPDLVRMLCQGDNPPLWELLLHFWVKIFGISEVSIRSLSLIFSALTVIPIYLLGERYMHRFAGTAAALCYCCSTFSIYLAHECRVYSLIGFATACSALLFVSFVKNPKPFKVVLLTLANLMLMYGHYLSVWTIVMEFLIFLTVRPIRKKIWKPYLLHVAALLLCFAPMFPVLFRRFMDSGVNGTWIAKTTSIEALYDFLWRMCNVPVTTVIAIVILIAALIKLIIKLFQKKSTFGVLGMLTLLWVVPLLVSFVLSFFTGFFLDRYFYFLFPLFYLSVCAYSLFLFENRKKLGVSLMAVFSLAMVLTCSPDSSTKRFSGWHSPIRPIVSQLEAAKSNGALVVMPECFDKQFTYYLDEKHEIFRTQSQPTNYYVFHDYLHAQGYVYDYEFVNADLSRCSEVLVPFHKAMPLEAVDEALRQQGFACTETADYEVYKVSRYVR